MHTKVVSVAATWDFAVVYLAGLVAALSTSGPVAPDWNKVERAIQSLPLSTDEFGPLTNRLNSARQYLADGERGAAKFELKQLVGRLERIRERENW